MLVQVLKLKHDLHQLRAASAASCPGTPEGRCAEGSAVERQAGPHAEQLKAAVQARLEEDEVGWLRLGF